MNEQITFTDGKQNLYTGNIIDINDDGTLLFECEKCGVTSLNSGEIALLNIYTEKGGLNDR